MSCSVYKKNGILSFTVRIWYRLSKYLKHYIITKTVDSIKYFKRLIIQVKNRVKRCNPFYRYEKEVQPSIEGIKGEPNFLSKMV